jgi:molybdopterin-binding protein
MMQDLCWGCKICEACGVCGRTEYECEIYQEYYGMGEKHPEKQCSVDSIIFQEALSPSESANRDRMNWLSGQIVKVVKSDVMAQVTIKNGDNYISSIMPIQMFAETGKNEGDSVTAAFKAVNVKIML